MPSLKVRMLHKDDIYKDLIRIPFKYRRDSKGQALIPEGRICKLTVSGKSRLFSVRGKLHEEQPCILMDAAGRDALKLRVGSEYDFAIREVGWLGQFLWAWRASDPLYRVASRFGLVSLLLGALGTILAVIGLYSSLPSH
jgi:hypothetical protein